MVWIPQWLNSLNLKVIVAWVVDNVAAGVIIGVVVGVILFSFSHFCIKRWQEIHDAKKIYNWLYNETKQWREFTVGDSLYHRWRSTREIASSNNLTIERARELCYTNEKLTLMSKEDLFKEDCLKPIEEKWAIKKFVR